MLMSYVVDAGKRAHGMDAMAEQWLGYKTLHYGDVAGSGKAQVCFDQVSIEKATEYAAEGAPGRSRRSSRTAPYCSSGSCATRSRPPSPGWRRR